MDTTCGSVLNVWKAVRRYAEDGFTSVIHGKIHHEETRATASQALKPPSAPYLVVLDREEAADVCRYIREGGDREAFLARYAEAASPGFDPDRDLARVGLANQTTMLMSESLDVGRDVPAGHGRPARRGAPSRSTIGRSTPSAAPPRTGRTPSWRCSTSYPVDLMVVIGGYNSSNTLNLAKICAARVPTYHVADDGVPGVTG